MEWLEKVDYEDVISEVVATSLSCPTILGVFCSLVITSRMQYAERLIHKHKSYVLVMRYPGADYIKCTYKYNVWLGQCEATATRDATTWMMLVFSFYMLALCLYVIWTHGARICLKFSR